MAVQTASDQKAKKNPNVVPSLPLALNISVDCFAYPKPHDVICASHKVLRQGIYLPYPHPSSISIYPYNILHRIISIHHIAFSPSPMHQRTVLCPYISTLATLLSSLQCPISNKPSCTDRHQQTSHCLPGLHLQNWPYLIGQTLSIPSIVNPHLCN